VSRIPGHLLARRRWTATTPERFWAKVAITDTCWNWTATTDTRGYGQLWVDGRFERAHRYSYELLVGPVPQGLELDHLCQNKGCVRPAHLEPVTHKLNTQRGIANRTSRRGMDHHNRRKTHCPQGHEYTPENTKWYRGGRACRACAREAMRQWRARERGFLVRSADEL
jgi:hypothetical protein